MKIRQSSQTSYSITILISSGELRIPTWDYSKIIRGCIHDLKFLGIGSMSLWYSFSNNNIEPKVFNPSSLKLWKFEWIPKLNKKKTPAEKMNLETQEEQ